MLNRAKILHCLQSRWQSRGRPGRLPSLARLLGEAHELTRPLLTRLTLLSTTSTLQNRENESLPRHCTYVTNIACLNPPLARRDSRDSPTPGGSTSSSEGNLHRLHHHAVPRRNWQDLPRVGMDSPTVRLPAAAPAAPRELQPPPPPCHPSNKFAGSAQSWPRQPDRHNSRRQHQRLRGNCNRLHHHAVPRSSGNS